MKSVRLSLFVYFLILLAAALGAVCWFGYESARAAYEAREASGKESLDIHYKEMCRQVNTDFDRELISRAQALISKLDRRALWVRNQVEPLYVLGLGNLQQHGHLQVWLWVAQAFHPGMTWRLRTPEFHLLPADKGEAPLLEEGEHYQFNTGFRLQPLAKSEKLSSWLPVDQELRRRANWQEYVDSVIGAEGKPLRRVIRSGLSIGRIQEGLIVPTLRPPGTQPKGPPGAGRGSVVFQYACETTARDEALADLKQTLDRDLAESREDTGRKLSALRANLLWIGAGTFLGLACGGFIIIRLGLVSASEVAR